MGTPAVPQQESESTNQERVALTKDLTALERRLSALRDPKKPALRWQDSALFAKGAAWGLRYDSPLLPADLALLRHAIERGNQRATELEQGKVTWATQQGRLTRAYISKVDGSVQPYGLIIPESYDPTKPTRLDVVLHGSTRPVGLSELRFISPFDEDDSGGKPAPKTNYIELHPLGRVENCYRWAGESDVFEAIEDVCRCYNIDRNRIVLRGMSMGASGTWHLGLKHPDYFAALAPYCGYVDTHKFSETPGMNFVKVGLLPEHQEKALRMLDSVDYAANVGVVPTIAAIGERDPFFQAHVIMGEAIRSEGLQMINLISPGTAHVQDPTTFAQQLQQIAPHVERGRNTLPQKIRFVTWTLKYPRCYWIELQGLEAHYQRAEIEAEIRTDGSLFIKPPQNITRFALLPPILQSQNARLLIGENEIRLPRFNKKQASTPLFIEKKGGLWVASRRSGTDKQSQKRPGLQGPIDDAFTTPFLCVRGTGKAWNGAIQDWAEANLRRFAYEWHRYFRGELPIKADTEVTEADCKRYNLILFGDPGSNSWIRKALPSLPVRWNPTQWSLDTKKFSSKDHAPVLITPSPFATKKEPRYLVLNSGHTFHEAELNRLNYLLFPRLGDWAVLRVGDKQPINPSESLAEEVLRAGFWNEQWKF